MKERVTEYGRIMIGGRDQLFREAVALTVGYAASRKQFSWALTGGSTPHQWYKWCIANRAIPPEVVAKARFTVSDERYVPLTSDQSNFGNAGRELLDPLGVPAERRFPWNTSLDPSGTVQEYRKAWAAESGPQATFDVCFLGMGEDAHTASLFPGSPLLSGHQAEAFTYVDVPERGLRFTITPTGLRAAGIIVVMAVGFAKTAALKKVFTGEFDPVNVPAQVLKTCADSVYWLLDTAAGTGVVE